MAGTKESRETDRQAEAGRPLNKSLHLGSIAAATGYLGTWCNILNISYSLSWFVTHNPKVSRQKQGK